MKDPIVEEVRKFRDEHSKKFNYNLDAIWEDFKAHQLNCGHKIIRLQPKKLANKLIQVTSKSSAPD
ncbi:MAG: hypothetical protein MRK02_05085 [Candidatus Scalindua sp.]|nr:hypothetical protein [Candidatus Scalindua sp.]